MAKSNRTSNRETVNKAIDARLAEVREGLQNGAQHPDLADEENPAYLFSTTNTVLLVLIASGEIDARALAMQMLADRGNNLEGHWAGFGPAASIANEARSIRASARERLRYLAKVADEAGASEITVPAADLKQV